jgi:hypothetical protein
MRNLGAWPLFGVSAGAFIGRAFYVEGIDGGLMMVGIAFGLLAIIRHVEVVHDRENFNRRITYDERRP